MKFLCDVHISFKLVKYIQSIGYECVHVNSILDKWFTTDAKIATYCVENHYILITKDYDFKNSYLLKKSPNKLIKINLGNISNLDLIRFFDTNMKTIIETNSNYQNFLIELDSKFIKIIL